jgi:8-oxo-dGTP pyrophosphatase MutT (NUDIX family)
MTEPAPARLAATLLLVRDGAEGLEVFMVARHRQIDFASGALVFPGGRVEDEDETLGGDSYEPRERALRVGAIRETFEESGVLIARARGESAWLDAARISEIAARAVGVSFGELIAREHLELGLEALTPFAHWITPKSMPKRFDTAFYIVEAPPGQIARHDGSESVDSVWISPRRAIEDAARGVFTIVPATRLNLQMLAESGDVAGALAAARERRIVPVEPIAEKTATGLKLRIPLEAGYGVDSFEL